MCKLRRQIYGECNNGNSYTTGTFESLILYKSVFIMPSMDIQQWFTRLAMNL